MNRISSRAACALGLVIAAASLAACDRDLVLRLKTEAREREHYYGLRVTSWDIYQFVIAKAGDSLSALEKWKREQ